MHRSIFLKLYVIKQILKSSVRHLEMNEHANETEIILKINKVKTKKS